MYGTALRGNATGTDFMSYEEAKGVIPRLDMLDDDNEKLARKDWNHLVRDEPSSMHPPKPRLKLKKLVN